jgi:ubiquinone/menaquinone biosynthesis C-methylase UbiE
MESPRKAYRGIGMEGPIATWYAKNTKGDVRDHRKCARAVADRVAPGGRVLELAPGPGYLALEIAKLGDYRITGLDISHSFVRIASENARAAGAAIDFRHGDAAHMPFPDDEFDFVVCRAAFKNFSDPVGALDEIHRVLKPGGRASIYDLRRNASRDAIDDEVSRMGMSRPSRLFTKAVFRFMLLKRAYTDAEMTGMCARTRFGTGEIDDDGIGFELRLVKR